MLAFSVVYENLTFPILDEEILSWHLYNVFQCFYGHLQQVAFFTQCLCMEKPPIIGMLGLHTYKISDGCRFIFSCLTLKFVVNLENFVSLASGNVNNLVLLFEFTLFFVINCFTSYFHFYLLIFSFPLCFSLSSLDIQSPDFSRQSRAKHYMEYSQKAILHGGDALFIPEGW